MVARFEYLHTVTREDIDDLGHAGNYHYIRWMQHAAVAHSTANGWPPERYDELRPDAAVVRTGRRRHGLRRRQHLHGQLARLRRDR